MNVYSNKLGSLKEDVQKLDILKMILCKRNQNNSKF